jgi:signal peptidase I
MKKILPYLLAIILCIYITYSLIDIVKVEDDSMNPLIQQGQNILAVNSDYFERNNIVIANVDVNGNSKRIVRRVYGIEGDYVSIQGNTVKVNEKVVKILEGINKNVEFNLTNEEYLLIGDNPKSTYTVVKKSQIESRLEVIL